MSSSTLRGRAASNAAGPRAAADERRGRRCDAVRLYDSIAAFRHRARAAVTAAFVAPPTISCRYAAAFHFAVLTAIAMISRSAMSRATLFLEE